MRKLLIFLIPIISTVLALGVEKIELMAEDLTAKDGNITASGNVVVHYQNSIIQASSATFDRKNHILTLNGERVELMGYAGSKIQSNQITINTENKETHFKKSFISDNNDIWIFAQSGIKKDSNMTFKSSMMSSCDIKNSDWTIYSENSHYDGKEHYMTMKDVKVKFFDVPVLYTPYLGFNTHSERASGILFPSIGYSEMDGFVYEQPIYWAPSKSWDIELNPQIRSTRGEGIYGTFRFADSPYSSGGIRLGYFQDKDSFVEEYDLENSEHYGFEMLYRSTNLIERLTNKPQDFTDGLYIDVALLNDIDYIYLQKKPMYHFGMASFMESKANYFINDDDYFLGVYGKYFIDTTQSENNATMQILPTVQLHKYLSTAFFDNLTYSLDFTANNYTREEGMTLKLGEFYAPIEYTTTIFDDFLSLSLKEDIYYKKAMYSNKILDIEDYDYFNGITRAKIFSDLTKKYDTFVHIIQPSLTYSLPSNDDSYFDKFEELNDEQRRLYSPGFEEEDISIRFSQYFYDEGGGLIFYQRFIQSYLPEQEEYNWGNLSNEMEYNIANWRFYNLLIYSHEFNKISEMSSRINWGGKGYGVGISHSFERIYSWGEEEEVKTYDKTNEVKLDLGYAVTDRLSLEVGMTYDIDYDKDEEELQSQYRVGFKYDKGCWNLALGLKQEIRPMQTKDGSKSIEENIIGFQLNFVPFGGIAMSTNDSTNQRY
jgi:LPS-assembly protein